MCSSYSLGWEHSHFLKKLKIDFYAFLRDNLKKDNAYNMRVTLEAYSCPDDLNGGLGLQNLYKV